MGRWEYCMSITNLRFDALVSGFLLGEQDFDITKDLGQTFYERPVQLSEMVHRIEMLVCP